jgi:GT2 family glycosyltransferase
LIDVVVPVYRGLAQTRTCIEAVLASRQREPFELVVVDDATPEPQIAAWLDGLAAAGRITLLRNASNQGFVRSVNRGMSLHADRDVVLLNSDTEVANDWLDRMAAAARLAADVATVTPFSNNATICSYPFEGWAGGVPGTLGLAGLDALVARANAGQTLDIPTGVGFCMYIRRAALAKLGLFDAERFGRGYGEENDFCMRAMKGGWRHLLAADVFVFHEGAVSFSDERWALIQAASDALLAVHPEYTTVVHTFIRRDPSAPLRLAIDVARATVSEAEARKVLEEQADERHRLVNGLWGIEKLAADHKAQIGQLNYALEHASQRVAERDRAIAGFEQEIARLHQELAQVRAGLAHAEKLAFDRQRELQGIYSSRTWRALTALARLRSRAAS